MIPPVFGCLSAARESSTRTLPVDITAAVDPAAPEVTKALVAELAIFAPAQT
jgi:hypothetical protein